MHVVAAKVHYLNCPVSEQLSVFESVSARILYRPLISRYKYHLGKTFVMGYEGYTFVFFYQNINKIFFH